MTKPYYNKNKMILVHSDTFKFLSKMKPESMDMIFADPPYFLSNGGISNSGGQVVSVDKGDWDKISSFEEKHEFNRKWIRLAKEVLKPNGRKNRTGDAMENIVQSYLEAEGYILGENLFKEIEQNEIEEIFSVDLSAITNDGNTVKRFDFVIKNEQVLYLIEVNFYSGSGSKLNETARSYKMIAEETKAIPNVEFMWITDGQGWYKAKNNLRETFDILPFLYNINDLEHNILKNLK